MNYPPMIEELADTFNEYGGHPYNYKPTADDIDLFLAQLQSDKYDDQRNALMDNLRDGLEDKFGISFAMAASDKNPTSPASLDVLGICNGIIRAAAALMIVDELDLAWTNAGGRWYDEDGEWDDLMSHEIAVRNALP